MPVPVQLLLEVVHDPAFAQALSWLVGPSPAIH
jgi:hypothetical protein